MRIKPLLAAAAVSLTLALPVSANPEFWAYEWPNTDFEQTSVENWKEILSGGPPKDGIPALSDPQFIRVDQESRIEDRNRSSVSRSRALNRALTRSAI